jgi:hypothetical protein
MGADAHGRERGDRGGVRWPGSTKPRGNSTGLGIFLLSRARIRALTRISSIHFCWCRKLTASVSGGFFAVAM